MKPGFVPSSVLRIRRYMPGPMGPLQLRSRDPDPFFLMCAAVMPFITMVCCLIRTMKMSARRYKVRKPSAI